ncbi:costars family protein ABRACL isoform X1 [Mustela erminea]|uniref:costars family protein ABRACL isoform X1 n=1 Tax=Mustela erminea TaxID=36723 RepID=UPI00138735D8|nr:costars family protein ABRACL isoform X1 [Mustela erminea]
MGPGGAEARGDCYWNWAETPRWGPGGRALTPPRLPPTSASAHVTLCRPGATGKPAARRRFPLRCVSAALPLQAAMNVDHEINLLVEEIHRLGSKNADGKLSVKFGVLFRDDKCANLFEALVGTLKAAKRRKIVTYPGELLLQGVHDDVDIILLQD